MDLHGLAGDPLGRLAHVRLDERRLELALALGHEAGDVVGELAGRLDDDRHASELGLRELVVADGLAEHLAVAGVREGRLVRGLHDADGAGRGLEPAVLEPGHLVVEALALATVETDQVGGWHEPVLQRDLIGVHTAVADGVDRATLHLSGAGALHVVLVHHEAVTLAAQLGDDEHRQAAVADRTVGVGTGEHHQDISAGTERAPRLDAVDDVALDAVLGRRSGRHGDAGDVGSEVGLGHGDGVHDLGRRELGKPLVLLLLGATGLEGPGEDLGAGDERTAGAEGAAGEFLGRDDHADVVTVGAGREAAVLLGDAEAEGAHLGEPGDEILGDVAVVAVDVLGDRLELLIGEAAEGILHHLEVVAQVTRPGSARQPGEELGVAVGRHVLTGRVEGVEADTPLRLTTEHLAGQLGDGVGDEGVRDRGLDVALDAVAQQALAGLHCGSRVGHVVGEDLVLVEADLGEPGDAGGHDLVGSLEGACSSGQINHGAEVTRG